MEEGGSEMKTEEEGRDERRCGRNDNGEWGSAFFRLKILIYHKLPQNTTFQILGCTFDGKCMPRGTQSLCDTLT